MCSASCAAERSTSPRCSSQASATERSTCLNDGQPMPRLGREVRAAEERLAGRGQEDRHRPAALACQRDDRVHVDRVEVGPLFAVDLDADEALVHDPCGEGVLEGLVLHHVAPVAGRVPDREQDRPVLVARAGQRLLAPGVPVDRIAGVLLEIRRRLLGQAVHTRSVGARRSLPARQEKRPRARTGTYALATCLGGATAAR